MNNNKDGQVKVMRGHINIIILKALNEGDKYGYEIGKYIESKSQDSFVLKQPTLYSSLKRLEDKDIISSYWGDADETNGGRRKYFKLTDLGKKIADKDLEDWKDSRGVIDEIEEQKKQESLAKSHSSFENAAFATAPKQSNDAEIVHRNTDTLYSHTKADSKEWISKQKNTAKTNEYKTILSKLLNNVKNDTDTYEMEFKQNQTDNALSLEKSLTTRDDLSTLIKENDISTERVLNALDTSKNENIKNTVLNTEINSYQRIGGDDIPDKGDFTLSQKIGHRETLVTNQLETQNQPQINKRQSTQADTPNQDLSFMKSDSATELIQKISFSEGDYSLLPSSNKAFSNSFTKLQNEMYQQGYTVRSHTNLKKENKQYLLSNKITHLSMIILYAIMCLQTLLIYYFCEPILQLGLKYYAYAALILLMFPFAATIQYLVNPHKKTKRRYYVKNTMISAIMVYLILVLGITSFALMFNVNVAIKSEVLLKMIIPTVYAFNYVIYAVIWSILYSLKKCFV